MEDQILLGNNVKIGKDVIMHGKIIIGDNCIIKDGVHINVTESFELGHDSVIGCKWDIQGRKIKIGHHLWCVDGDGYGNGIIGGGSCFDCWSELEIGNYCHLGLYTLINTARKVKMGNNVGFGYRCVIFTHGAWQNVLEGYPAEFGSVIIEDNAWLPSNITVMPNVLIGEGATITSGAVVNKNVPPYCLAGGVPIKLIRQQSEYLPSLKCNEKMNILRNILKLWAENMEYQHIEISWKEGDSYFLINNCYQLFFWDKKNISCKLEFDLTMYKLTYNKHDLIGDKLLDFLRKYGIKAMEN